MATDCPHFTWPDAGTPIGQKIISVLLVQVFHPEQEPKDGQQE
jgi:hypothetical protein